VYKKLKTRCCFEVWFLGYFYNMKIIDALESGDSDFAERAIAEHLKAAAIAIDQHLQRS
jgi:hypothetical protein